jgi:hypothetical protein
MPRINILSAGNAGFTSAKVNVNQTQMGNKLQGLPVRSHNSSINFNRAYGGNRNVVFSVNQLGGIGRNNSMFKSNSDGNRSRAAYTYN